MSYIAIEGVIGAGKTTLAKKLADLRGSNLLLERYEENPFLSDFYQNRAKNAFPVEMFFLADRVKHLQQFFNSGYLFSQETIADFGFFKSFLFAKINLEEAEFKLYKEFYDLVENKVPQPDKVMFVYRSLENLKKNIRFRGRAYEQLIDDSYLKELQDIYMSFLKHAYKGKLLLINADDLNFLNGLEDVLKVNDILEQRGLD